MKKIAKILFWSVLFVWMIFLQPQNVMATEADEIIKELDFTDINAQTQDLPEKIDFCHRTFICAVRKSDDDATGVCFADELFYCLSWGGSVVAAIICPDLRGGRSGD